MGGHADSKKERSRQGKVEKSLLTFVATYPTWEPPAGAKAMMAAIDRCAYLCELPLCYPHIHTLRLLPTDHQREVQPSMSCLCTPALFKFNYISHRHTFCHTCPPHLIQTCRRARAVQRSGWARRTPVLDPHRRRSRIVKTIPLSLHGPSSRCQQQLHFSIITTMQSTPSGSFTRAREVEGWRAFIGPGRDARLGRGEQGRSKRAGESTALGSQGAGP